MASSPDKVAAIYVPIELENDVEEWLKRKYNIRQLAESPRRQRSADMSILRSSPTRSRKPENAEQTKSVSSARPRSSSKSTPQRNRAADAPMKEFNPHERKRVTSAPKRSTPNRKINSTEANRDGDVWTRLATTPKRERCTEPQQSTSTRKKRTQPSLDESGKNIYDRLYFSGISQYERQQRAAEEARQRRAAEEDAEIQRGKVLMKVLSNSENYALRGAAFEEKMTEAMSKTPKLTEDEIRNISSRLSRRSSSSRPRPLTKEEREMTFHPKISDTTRVNDQELHAHFNHLYMDGRKRDRQLEELRQKYEEKEKRIAFERRMRDDVAFRRKMEQSQ